MKKVIKLIVTLAAIVAVPALTGLGIKMLWNNIITSVCGFAAISFWQSVGIFLLGQLLSGGFLIMLFILASGIHSLCHHHRNFHDHWHKMTDEERREFILRRREHFGFSKHPQKEDDAAE